VRLRQYLVDLLVGAPLASNAQAERKTRGVHWAARLRLDGLSSSAYDPEAARALICNDTGGAIPQEDNGRRY
jgi:hypothetical protein